MEYKVLNVRAVLEHHARVTSAVSDEAEEAQPLGQSIARRAAGGAVFPLNITESSFYGKNWSDPHHYRKRLLSARFAEVAEVAAAGRARRAGCLPRVCVCHATPAARLHHSCEETGATKDTCTRTVAFATFSHAAALADPL